MFQRMEFGLLEVVAPVNRVKPHIQKVLGPLPVPYDEAARGQTVLVLRDDEVYSVAFQVAERLDDAVGWHDGRICEHDALELRGREHRRVDGDGGIQDYRRVV
jgi:hypothetical protein